MSVFSFPNRVVVIAAAAVVGVGGVIAVSRGGPTVPGGGGGGATITCDQTAATASQASLTTAISAASNGQTVCMSVTGSYGTFAGTSKTITIVSQAGTGAPSPVSNSMDLSLGSGDSGFTIDGGMTSPTCSCGMSLNGGLIAGGASAAHDITFKNFRSTGSGRVWNMDPTTTGANITIDHAYFHDMIGGEANIYIWTVDGPIVDTGIVIKNSLFKHFSTDGVKLSGQAKASVLNNFFVDARESYAGDGNHTDAIQFNCGCGSLVRGNVVHDVDACISGYDNQNTVAVTHNVVWDCTSSGLQAQRDSPASTLKWNTVGPTSAGPGSDIACGNDGNAGKGTTVSIPNIYDNVAFNGVSTNGAGGAGGENCAPTRNDHNSSGAQTLGVGSMTVANMNAATTITAFCLASSSAGYSVADTVSSYDGSSQVGLCGGDFNPSTDGPPPAASGWWG